MYVGLPSSVPPSKFGRVGAMNIDHVKFICLVQATLKDWCALNGDRWLIRFEDCGLGAMKEDSKVTSAELINRE